MILTEEEIDKAYSNGEEEVYITPGLQRVAEAQLKKVIKYLEPHIYIRKDAPYKSTIDAEAWQALIEEIE